MSVVVKDTAGDFWLYCKGADSAMFPLIISGKINEAIAHVADFSMVGKFTNSYSYLISCPIVTCHLKYYLKNISPFREVFEPSLLGTRK